MQPHLHCPRCPKTLGRQSTHRSRTGGLWDPIEQETASNYCSKEGEWLRGLRPLIERLTCFPGTIQERGGINITHTVPLTKMDQDEIRAVLGEYKMNNCDIAIRQVDATIDDLVDVIEGNRVYIPAIYVSPAAISLHIDAILCSRRV